MATTAACAEGCSLPFQAEARLAWASSAPRRAVDSGATGRCAARFVNSVRSSATDIPPASTRPLTPRDQARRNALPVREGRQPLVTDFATRPTPQDDWGLPIAGRPQYWQMDSGGNRLGVRQIEFRIADASDKRGPLARRVREGLVRVAARLEACSTIGADHDLDHRAGADRCTSSDFIQKPCPMISRDTQNRAGTAVLAVTDVDEIGAEADLDA